MFYNLTEKEILKIRNDIFLKYGLPELTKNGFERSPFRGVWFGRNPAIGFMYDFARISDSYLEFITLYIAKGDKYLKFNLNIFKLQPSIKDLDQLKDLYGGKFRIPPNSLTNMILRIDDYKGIPLFYMLFRPEHKIGCYLTAKGFKSRVKKLEQLISRDMRNIDSFVKRWHEMHKPFITDWEGNIVDSDLITEK